MHFETTIHIVIEWYHLALFFYIAPIVTLCLAVCTGYVYGREEKFCNVIIIGWIIGFLICINHGIGG